MSVKEHKYYSRVDIVRSATFSIQHLGNIKVLLSYIKCQVEVVQIIALHTERERVSE